MAKKDKEPKRKGSALLGALGFRHAFQRKHSKETEATKLAWRTATRVPVYAHRAKIAVQHRFRKKSIYEGGW